MAAVFGGPAVIEIFGEKDFMPVNKEANPKYNEEQQKLCVEYASKAGEIVNKYIKGEERSFTIIAFPVPEIGEKYEEIFDEIVKINTLDYKKYQRIQQALIDTLDQAKKVHIVGDNGNKTDLYVALGELANPEKETNFENCVADVNIPVGEVFTSPKLNGTDGILHVKHVFLNAYEFKDLEVCFQNGMIVRYGCANFDSEAENLKYIRDNVLFHHDTLPMGEFAIGTNVTAYVACKKYGIEDIFYLFGSIVFLSAAFNLFIVIREKGLMLTIYLFLITTMTDTFAYIIGSKKGKKKLLPDVSPNKSVEGFIGGLVVGTAVASLFYYFCVARANILLVVFVTMILSIVGQCGDLVFSQIKRYFGIKDYSNLMPGHGGVLDRLDSMIFVLFGYIIISVIL